jgi:hypothetical protein
VTRRQLNEESPPDWEVSAISLTNESVSVRLRGQRRRFKPRFPQGA